MENIENKIPNGENQDTQNSSFFSENVSSSNGLEAKFPLLRFRKFSHPWKQEKLSNFTSRIMRKNSNNETELPLTISSKDGLVDQVTFFNKKVSSKDMSGYYLLKNGEFAYNKSYSNGYDFGSIKRLERYEMGALSTLYICFSLKKHCSDYIKHYFDSLKWYRQIYVISAEGARNHGLLNVPTDDFFATTHYLSPYMEEQQKIANFLSLVDQRIEKQRQLVESLKKYKRGLFLKLYNDSDKSIMLFKNIYKVASEGGTPSTLDTENYKNGKLPFIKIDDLNQHYLTSAKYFITEKGLKKSSAWLVPENSIIYSNGATIGACSINKIPVTTKQGILGIVPKSNFSVEFLYFFFTSSLFKEKIRAITTKGTMDCAYLKDINDIKISIPDFTVQQKISKIMVDFENLIEYTEFSLMHLHNIKKGLLQQMFI